MSNKAFAVLFGILFVSGLAIVHMRTRYLFLFTHEQHLAMRRDALRVEWGRLLLEQGTLTEQQRIVRIARHRLHMAMPNPRHIVLLYTQAASVP